ncbi:MAG: DUF3592 domain-containing protein [Chloroflexota bacterium]
MNNGLFSILGYLLVISGVLLLLGGVLAWLRAQQKYSAWISVDGVVTSVVSHSIGAANFHYYPVVEFRTQAGKMVRFESELGFYPARHKPGQTVSVWYDPADPGRAMLDLAAAKWTAPLALGIFGAIATLIGGIILSVM